MNFCGPKPENVAQMREHFEKCLSNAITGSPDWPSHRGSGSFLTEQTAGALERVARSRPNPDPALIADAREEFERQLDGTHGAKLAASIMCNYPEWPDTPFAGSVKSAFDHILIYVADPWAHEEADDARADLDRAAEQSSQRRVHILIAEVLRLMLDEIDVIPEYEFVNEAKATARWLAQRQDSPAWTYNTLSALVAYAEGGDQHCLYRAEASLENAEARRPPGNSRRARDEGYIIDHLTALRADLERSGGQ